MQKHHNEGHRKMTTYTSIGIITPRISLNKKLDKYMTKHLEAWWIPWHEAGRLKT